MKIEIRREKENPAFYNTLGDYENPNRIIYYWEEIDVTEEELLDLINNSSYFKIKE